MEAESFKSVRSQHAPLLFKNSCSAAPPGRKTFSFSLVRWLAAPANIYRASGTRNPVVSGQWSVVSVTFCSKQIRIPGIGKLTADNTMICANLIGISWLSN